MLWPAAMAALVLALGCASAQAEPAKSPSEQARALLVDYFGPDQKPPRKRTRKLEDWMTSRFAGLWKRAVAKGEKEGDPFPGADPILNAQDSDRPGDIRIEGTGGTPDRPTVKVSFKVFAGDPTRSSETLVFSEDRDEWRLYDVVHDGPDGASSLRKSVEDYLSPKKRR